MIDLYLNQTVTLKSNDEDPNGYNEDTYTSSQISVRQEYEKKTVRLPNGEEMVSESTVYTTTAVKPDDLITIDSIDWRVLTVRKCIGLDGTINHYEVFL